MGKVVILGCGYVGKAAARFLIDNGAPVRATTTTETRLSELTALGAEPMLIDTRNPKSFEKVLHDAEAIIHLAPPGENDRAYEARLIARSVGPGLRAYVYGSTTGAFGQHDREAWVDERTAPKDLSPRGRARLEYEQALAAAGLPLRVVRISGIYGPGRTLRDSIERNALILFRDGPVTSRIHVEDLARIVVAMLASDAPKLVVACDEEPAPTLDVAKYTAELLGCQLPELISIEDAKRVLSPQALELRLGGHRCRSKLRARLIGDLSYPTYREGVRASLEAEGVKVRRSPMPVS